MLWTVIGFPVLPVDQMDQNLDQYWRNHMHAGGENQLMFCAANMFCAAIFDDVFNFHLFH